MGRAKEERGPTHGVAGLLVLGVNDALVMGTPPTAVIKLINALAIIKHESFCEGLSPVIADAVLYPVSGLDVKVNATTLANNRISNPYFVFFVHVNNNPFRVVMYKTITQD